MHRRRRTARDIWPYNKSYWLLHELKLKHWEYLINLRNHFVQLPAENCTTDWWINPTLYQTNLREWGTEQDLMWTNDELLELASPCSVQSGCRCTYWLTFSKIVREGCYDILQYTIIIWACHQPGWLQTGLWTSDNMQIMCGTKLKWGANTLAYTESQQCKTQQLR